MKSYVITLLLLCCFATANAAWTTPTPLTSINTPGHESGAVLSSDGLTIYYASDYYTGGTFKLYSATRANTASSFSNIKPISELNTSYGHIAYPWISQDSQRLYYSQNYGGAQLKMSTWNPTTSSWGVGEYLSSLNAFGSVDNITFSADEKTAAFIKLNGGKWDLYMGTRTSLNSAFTVRNISELNTTAHDGGGYLSADGLSLYFHSDRTGEFCTYKSTRLSLNDQFGAPQMMPFGNFGQPVPFDGGMLLNSNWEVYVTTPEPASMLLLGLGALAMRFKR